MSRSVVIIGLGSRGLGLLERIVTLARLAGPDGGEIVVHVVDPTCGGEGVHRLDQPDYLLLNTTCAQVSMFPDRHSVGSDVDGDGPTLFDWVTERGLRIGADGFTVSTAGRPIRPHDFLPRRLLGEYLGWFRGEVLGRAPEHVRVVSHRGHVVDLADGPARGLVVTLADGTSFSAGYAFLTTGYGSREDPDGPGQDRVVHAPYPIPDRTAEVRPGQTVAIGGFGLTAMDVLAGLTVGRGGRYVTESARLRYLPSGREPNVLLYSRSGLPCRARPLVVEFGPPYEPVAFTTANIDALRAEHGGPLDFDAHVLPLVLTEMRVAYHRCVARGAGTEPELVALIAEAGWPGVLPLLDRLDREHGPFDAPATFEGTAGMLLGDHQIHQKWLAGVLRADLAEGLLGFVGSPVKAALDVLRELRDTFRYVVDFGGLTPASLDRFTCHTMPMLNRAVVGPQYERHTELLALMDAGLVRVPFGPSPTATWNRSAGRWRIESTRLAEPYAAEVDWLIRAHVSPPRVEGSTNALVSALHAKGWIRPHRPESRYVGGIDLTPDQHPIRADGSIERRMWVLGPLCEGTTFYNNLVPSPGRWSRPVADAHRCAKAMLARG
jgi:uncharacterized NAD(P)/FAD-binding protein YdhS